MRNLLSVLALTSALVAPVAFAADQQPAQPPSGQYDRTTPQKDQQKEQADEKVASADFAALDKNKDGKITEDELPADSPVATHFAMLDTDKDGALSKSEFRKAHSMMR